MSEAVSPTRARWPVPRSPRLYAGVLAGVAALLAAGWWIYHQVSHVQVDDARVANDMVSISSRVAGWATQVRVIDGDSVAKGSLLVAIDERDSRLHIQELEARLAGIPARREELQAQIRMIDRRTESAIRAQKAAVQAAAADRVAAEARENLARTENRRAEELAPIGAMDRAQLDQSRAALETSRQEARRASANLDNARAAVAQAQAEREQLAVLKRQLAELEPQEAELRAQLERARLDLLDRAIVMPFDGVVDKVFVDAGEYVSPGQRLLLVHDPARVRVEANVKETDIRFFRPGKKVGITVDALPGQTFEGSVERVGNAATSEFALLPNPNPSGNFTKITQRLPVRIAVRQRDGLLKPGMMVEVEARAGD